MVGPIEVKIKWRVLGKRLTTVTCETWVAQDAFSVGKGKVEVVRLFVKGWIGF